MNVVICVLSGQLFKAVEIGGMSFGSRKFSGGRRSVIWGDKGELSEHGGQAGVDMGVNKPGHNDFAFKAPVNAAIGLFYPTIQ